MNKKSLDSILSNVSIVFGTYSNNIVIGGGIALLVYRYYFAEGYKLLKPAVTKDLDLLIPRKLNSEELLSKRLTEFGFKRTTLSLETPPVESYSALIEGEEIILEFLTDRRSRGDNNKNVLVGGISAQPLSYIEMSLENPISFYVGNKLHLQVVSPERWLFHKALTFTKRRSKAKLCKDLYGIWYVGTQLGVFSAETINKLSIVLQDKPSSWRTKIRKELSAWISEASPAEWRMLEEQDPAQSLSKLSFIDFIEKHLLDETK